MVWGAFSANGFTPLYRIEGNLNSGGYIELIQNKLLPAIPTLLPNGGLFPQDNAPVHVSKQTTTFLDNNNINRIDCIQLIVFPTRIQLKMYGTYLLKNWNQ